MNDNFDVEYYENYPLIKNTLIKETCGLTNFDILFNYFGIYIPNNTKYDFEAINKFTSMLDSFGIPNLVCDREIYNLMMEELLKDIVKIDYKDVLCKN